MTTTELQAREDGKGVRKELVHTDVATWMIGGREEARPLEGGLVSRVADGDCDDDDRVAE